MGSDLPLAAVNGREPNGSASTQRQTVAWYLRHVSKLLAGLSDDDLQRLVPHLAETQFRKGQVLFAAGEPSEWVYLLVRGQVKVYASACNGRDVILHVAAPGDLVGDMALAEDGRRTVSAEAISDVVALRISWDEFRGFMRRSPQLGYAMAESLARRLQGMQLQFQSVVARPVAARLASLLLSRAVEEADGRTRARLLLTHLETAQLLGTSRETVTALFGRFQQLGMIEGGKREVTILDRDLLQRCAEAKLQVSPRHALASV